ncbi:hypothetical protein RND81_O265200 [Saponaria officinalis]|uniref:Polyprotein n=1 Tax=Saponaria officinalis TaxID=3572 RepID=A0AAW1GFK4_SAPOF
MKRIEFFYQNLRHEDPIEEQILEAKRSGIIKSYFLTTLSAMNARRVTDFCLWCDAIWSVHHICEHAPDYNCRFSFGEDDDGMAFVKVTKEGLKPVEFQHSNEGEPRSDAEDVFDEMPGSSLSTNEGQIPLSEDNQGSNALISDSDNNFVKEIQQPDAHNVLDELPLPTFIKEMVEANKLAELDSVQGDFDTIYEDYDDSLAYKQIFAKLGTLDGPYFWDLVILGASRARFSKLQSLVHMVGRTSDQLLIADEYYDGNLTPKCPLVQVKNESLIASYTLPSMSSAKSVVLPFLLDDLEWFAGSSLSMIFGMEVYNTRMFKLEKGTPLILSDGSMLNLTLRELNIRPRCGIGYKPDIESLISVDSTWAMLDKIDIIVLGSDGISCQIFYPDIGRTTFVLGSSFTLEDKGDFRGGEDTGREYTLFNPLTLWFHYSHFSTNRTNKSHVFLTFIFDPVILFCQCDLWGVHLNKPCFYSGPSFGLSLRFYEGHLIAYVMDGLCSSITELSLPLNISYTRRRIIMLILNFSHPLKDNGSFEQLRSNNELALVRVMFGGKHYDSYMLGIVMLTIDSGTNQRSFPTFVFDTGGDIEIISNKIKQWPLVQVFEARVTMALMYEIYAANLDYACAETFRQIEACVPLHLSQSCLGCIRNCSKLIFQVSNYDHGIMMKIMIFMPFGFGADQLELLLHTSTFAHCNGLAFITSVNCIPLTNFQHDDALDKTWTFVGCDDIFQAIDTSSSFFAYSKHFHVIDPGGIKGVNIMSTFKLFKENSRWGKECTSICYFPMIMAISSLIFCPRGSYDCWLEMKNLLAYQYKATILKKRHNQHYVFDPGGLVRTQVINAHMKRVNDSGRSVLFCLFFKCHLSLILEDKDHLKRRILIHTEIIRRAV